MLDRRHCSGESQTALLKCTAHVKFSILAACEDCINLTPWAGF